MKNFTGTVNKIGLETKTCERCGGSGRYSFNLMHGSTCYGCGGVGMVLTSRGKKARAFMIDLQTQPLSRVQVGDSVWTEVVTNNGVGGGKFRKVIAVYEDGYETKMTGRYSGLSKTDTVRTVRDQAELDETIKQALAYQETL